MKSIIKTREDASDSVNELTLYGYVGGLELPKSVDFANTLSLNPSGKVLKRELRESYWQCQGSGVVGS